MQQALERERARQREMLEVERLRLLEEEVRRKQLEIEEQRKNEAEERRKLSDMQKVILLNDDH